MQRTLKDYLLLLLKGVGMGSADVVPGVSGGTIAFITGIYQELLDSIRSVDGQALGLLLKFKIGDFWQKINGNFLAAVFGGIMIAVLSLAKLLTYLLEHFPIQLWSFFFGLIIASALLVGKQVTQWSMGGILAGIVGVVLAYFITITSGAQTSEAMWFVFVAGMIAICAMILPGISGSFILVLLGKYTFILAALKEFKISIIAVFMSGCIVGILSFSHLLGWMLKRYYNLTIIFLIGIMIGSLNKVWPWKKVLETYTDSHGKVKPLLEKSILPSQFEGDPYLMYAIIFAVVGFALVYIIERLAPKQVN
ncbi:DUF368 domain-containing protein [Microscilla marina]|uniref:Integral membrane protein n=1 Tax=Microscilla marina ATCC 23134 TaxID=313606 RepID=A1ZKQ7_MICM2|nr:DUF368 domain-containing protein [Microscilla marina]EAY28873.1 integral membrane protein [Microscilla marina ATCC 23134]